MENLDPIHALKRRSPSSNIAQVIRKALCTALILSGTILLNLHADQCEQVDQALIETEILVDQHRFPQIVTRLETLIQCPVNDELRYRLTAELGRAYFHLARYQEAQKMLSTAVRLRPQQVESAIYLQACLYINQRQSDALLIYEQILRAGARDLYQAVTLPGERAFLRDPKVWDLNERYAQRLSLSLEDGTFRGVRLNDSRVDVAQVFGVGSSAGERSLLTARAGPRVLWAFAFDPRDQLHSIVVNAEYIVKYTPYRLEFSHGFSWTVTPAEAIAALGPANPSETLENGDLVLSWRFNNHGVRLVFGLPQPPRPPAIPEDMGMLKTVELSRLVSAPL